MRLSLLNLSVSIMRVGSVAAARDALAAGSRGGVLVRGQQRGFASTARRSNERVVICGTGWAGHEILRRIDKRRYDVTVISPNTYSVHTPLLAGAAVGTIEFRAALDPVRYRLRNAR